MQANLLSKNKDGVLIEGLANDATSILVLDAGGESDPDISEYFASLDYEKMRDEAIKLAVESF